ncbi:hypothetical protein TNCV_4007531 [Trichonephila clavipes]|nr:hypothetical protein TNCV_4007531 [Trichonephila clavipes]
MFNATSECVHKPIPNEPNERRLGGPAMGRGQRGPDEKRLKRTEEWEVASKVPFRNYINAIGDAPGYFEQGKVTPELALRSSKFHTTPTGRISVPTDLTCIPPLYVTGLLWHRTRARDPNN